MPNMLCHYALSLNERAICGVFPDWSTTSPGPVTCPACREMLETKRQEWLCLEILADAIPPEPDTITDAVNCLYGVCDLEHASAEELDNWWQEIKEYPFGE